MLTAFQYQLLPDLSPEEYEALRVDIAKRGVMVPIEYDEQGNVLDGHHRLRVCQELGITDWPRVVRLGMSEDAKREHVLALNLDRRHLTGEQRKELEATLWASGMSKRHIANVLHVDPKTVRNDLSGGEYSPPENVTGKDGKEYPAQKPVTIFNPKPSEVNWLAQMDEKQVHSVANKIAAGQAENVTQAVQAVARDNRPPKAITPPPPVGKFSCIVIDPPWPMKKIEREERPFQGEELPYSTMTLEQIERQVGGWLEKVADTNCHLYLWVTQKYLPAGLALLEAWGFQYQCLMTWVKPTGMTPYSWMYNTEHVLFAHKGNLPLQRLGLKLSFEAPVTRHSEKPDIFYERVIAASAGPRLDLFARKERDGFECWGNEVSGDGSDPTNTASVAARQEVER